MFARPSSRLLALAVAGLALSLALPALAPQDAGPASAPAQAADAPAAGVAPPAIPAPPSERDLLLRAARQARGNCLRAMLTGQGLGPAHSPLFETDALLAALETDRVEAHAYGELPAIEAELRWLGTLTPTSDLGDRSWEDVRFLLGGLHGYVDATLTGDAQAASTRHAQPASAYDSHALRAFRGLDFGDLLGLWD